MKVITEKPRVLSNLLTMSYLMKVITEKPRVLSNLLTMSCLMKVITEKRRVKILFGVQFFACHHNFIVKISRYGKAHCFIPPFLSEK